LICWKNRRNKLIWNYGFWDGNRAGTSAAISCLYTVGLCWFWDMLLCSMSPTFWPEGLPITDFVWGLSPEEHFWKITLQDSLVRRPLYHIFTVGLIWILDMLFVQMLYNIWTVKIGNKHSYQKLYFLNSLSLNFRSVRYCSDIGRFNRWMYVNFGYVILMMMMYNYTVWICWILKLQNYVLNLVWEILNENMMFSIKSMFWD
jgi:hypothetical protein